VCQPRHRALVEEVYSRLNEVDLDAVELFHPQAEWHWGSAAPGQSVYRGREQLRKGLMLWRESWGDFRMDPEEVLEAGDDVFVMARYRARGAGSGVEFHTTVAHLLEIREGLITRWWMFGDADKARRRFLSGDRPG
jgi:ketosteroid isomerase-like protein